MEPSSSDLAMAQAYFDRFAEAFATFDGSQVSDLFATPGVALGRDGSLTALTTREDVIRYYQTALERYHRDGCRSCQWSQLAVTPMGRRSLLATVTWDLLREDGTILTRWRQSYSLRNTKDDRPKAFASAMHVE